MKKIFLAIIAAAALVALPAVAQTYGTISLLTGGTNNCAALATNSYTGQSLLLEVNKRSDVGIAISYVGNSTTNNVGTVFVFDQSLDASTFSTVNRYRFTFTGDSTNTATLITNITVNAVGWLRLNSIENSSSNAFTNIVISYSVKPGK